MNPYEVSYTGSAVLLLDDDSVDADVVLTGHMEPLDGKYHWYGRVSASNEVRELKDRAGRTDVRIAVSGRRAVPARLTELDPFGNVRIVGTGTPPYALETLEDVDHG